MGAVSEIRVLPCGSAAVTVTIAATMKLVNKSDVSHVFIMVFLLSVIVTWMIVNFSLRRPSQGY
jgi:hypothetical protein